MQPNVFEYLPFEDVVCYLLTSLYCLQSISEYIPIIFDGKRGDIGSTANAYATASRSLGVEAVTVNAYMGNDTLTPFTSDPAMGTFILCKTSNPSSAELQELRYDNVMGVVVYVMSVLFY